MRFPFFPMIKFLFINVVFYWLITFGLGALLLRFVFRIIDNEETKILVVVTGICYLGLAICGYIVEWNRSRR